MLLGFYNNVHSFRFFFSIDIFSKPKYSLAAVSEPKDPAADGFEGWGLREEVAQDGQPEGVELDHLLAVKINITPAQVLLKSRKNDWCSVREAVTKSLTFYIYEVMLYMCSCGMSLKTIVFFLKVVHVSAFRLKWYMYIYFFVLFLLQRGLRGRGGESDMFPKKSTFYIQSNKW